MFYRPWEQPSQLLEDPVADPPRTPPRIEKERSDAEESESDLESYAAKQSRKQKGKFHPRVIEKFVHVKSLVLDDKSILTGEEVQRKIYETMRDLMPPSGLTCLNSQGW
jgi:hypothetical protein